MPRGGYQPPANPAPVAMPGALSRRTDGGPADKQPMRDIPNAAYGEQQTFHDQQASAPMDAAPQGPGVQPVDLSNVVAMDADTEHPDMPVTAGAPMGEGPGTEALGLGSADDPAVQHLQDILPSLELMANNPTAGFAFKQYVRRVRATM